MKKPELKYIRKIKEKMGFIAKYPFQFIVNITLSILIFPGPFLAFSIFLIYISYEYGVEPSIGFDDRFWHMIALILSIIVTFLFFLFLIKQLVVHKTYTPLELNPYAKKQEIKEYNKVLIEKKDKMEKHLDHHKTIVQINLKNNHPQRNNEKSIYEKSQLSMSKPIEQPIVKIVQKPTPQIKVVVKPVEQPKQTTHFKLKTIVRPTPKHIEQPKLVEKGTRQIANLKIEKNE